MRTRKLEHKACYDRNTDKFWDCGELCACCGRPVSNPTNFVHLVDGGHLILHPDDEELYDEDDPGNCGLYPIGPECAKGFKGWVFKEE